MQQTPHHRRGRRVVSLLGKAPAMVASYIDVVFLLLVYFVVTDTFAQGEGVLTANFPDCCGPGLAEKLPQPIKISVRSVGKTGYRLNVSQLNQAPKTFAQLRNQMQALHRGDANAPANLYDLDTLVTIEPNGDVRWQHVLNAYNAAVSAGYTNVAFAAAPDTQN
jgi:biopolymer transport protein ExbD